MMFRKGLSLVIAFTLVTANWPIPAALGRASSPIQEEYKRAIEKFDRSMSLLEELRTHIDRSQFDLDAIVEKLDYDAGRISQFVKEEIYFEQYAGLLRGAEGTLISRAGNALDQAVLLAKLLGDAGYDARIVETTLSDDQASALLQEMKNVRASTPPVGDMNKIELMLSRIAAESGVPTAEIEELMQTMKESPARQSSPNTAAVRAEVEFILDILDTNQIELEDDFAYADLRREASEYHFVEYRESAAAGWVSIHPSFSGNDPSWDTLESRAYFADSVPEKLQHRFKFEILLTSETLGRKATTHLLPTWERPVANLIGNPLTYTNISKNLLDEKYLESAEIGTLESEVFLPSFNNNISGDGFDMQGNIIPSDAAGSMYAALFQNVSNKLKSVAQALVDIGNDASQDSNAVRQLSTVEIRYTLIEPHGNKREFTRTVYDASEFQGKDNAYMGAIQALTRQYTISVGGGSISPTYVMDRLIADVLLRRPLSEAMLRYKFGMTNRAELQSEVTGKGDTSWIGHPILELVQGSIATEIEGTVSYFFRPSIVVHYREMPINSSALEVVDMVARPHRVLDQETLEPVPDQQVLVGVWETYHEGVLFGESVDSTYDTKTVFDRARNDNTDFIVIKPTQQELVSKLGLPRTADMNIRRDLSTGNILILPRKISDTNPRRIAWWRIDPNSGATLGISGTGEGMSATEYLVLTAFVFGALMLVCIFTTNRRDPENPNPSQGSAQFRRCVGMAGSTTAVANTVHAFSMSSPLAPAGLLLAAIAYLNAII